jgi:hypothetical protein
MKNRSISGLLALVLFACITQAAAVKEVPMKGNGTGQITGQNGPEITAVGGGEATHLGKFTREEVILLNPDGTATGTIIFTAADGSQLFCEFIGAFTSPTTVSGTYTFTGGTGRLDGASGSAFFNISLGEAGSFSFGFAGTIEMN